MKKLLIVLPCAIWLTACDQPPAESNPASSAPVPAAEEAETKPKLASADLEFMKEAARGGMAEVKMGQLGLSNGRSPQVKSFAQRLVTDHTKANQELEKLAIRKEVTLPDGLGEQHQTMLQHLSSLRGAQFDDAFRQHAVEDHEKDVQRFEKAASRAKDPELRSFAEKTLPVLREHLELAKGLGGPTSVGAATGR